jgi:hypothetical protein
MRNSHVGMDRNARNTANLGSLGDPEILVFKADKVSLAVWNIVGGVSVEFQNLTSYQPVKVSILKASNVDKSGN